MKKSMLFAAAAVVAMVGCTNEDFTGLQQSQNGEAAINFGSGTKKITRAEKTGADAAALLDNNFVVVGFKGSKTTQLTTDATKVFDFYNVNWDDNSAGSTESNSSNWEYVGQEVNALTRAKSQTIKYWDFALPQYDFIAFSKGQNTKDVDQYFAGFNFDNVGVPAAGTDNTVYTITGTLSELQNCYVADILTVKAAQYGEKPVTPRFRRMQSKIRLGIYETVPGYSVKDVKFYTSATAPLATDGTEMNATLYAADNVLASSGANAMGVMKVSYPTVDADGSAPSSTADPDNNQAHISFEVSSGSTLSSTLAFNTLDYSAAQADEAAGNVYLGRTSATATYATNADEQYVPVLPTGKGEVLNLKVDYTLVSIDGSGEEINVVGATAVVPSIYTEWQPNFAYTYLFKISDETNGKTNPTGFPDKAGLYPITFDAVVEGDIDGVQETITKVGEPSITTYQQGKVVTENDEYKASENIYVTVNDGVTLSDKSYEDGYVNVYKATTSGSIQTITEASVANCYEQKYDPTGTATTFITKNDVNGGTLTLNALDNSTTDKAWELLTAIPNDEAPHGVVIPTNGADKQVACINNPTAGIYVFQYTPVIDPAEVFGTPEYKTLKTGKSYYSLEISTGTVESTPATKYTYTEESAVGNEKYEANKYFKEPPSLASLIAAPNPNTLKAGEKFYKKSGDTYTEFIAKGDEDITTGWYYTGEPVHASSITTGATYYVKVNKNYIAKTATDNINPTDSDPYYTATFSEVTSGTTLKAGETYIKQGSSTLEILEFVSTGKEPFEPNTYYNQAKPADVELNPTDDFNTLSKDAVVYTITTDTSGKMTAAPAKKITTGIETSTDLTANDKVYVKAPKSVYKVIRVAQ